MELTKKTELCEMNEMEMQEVDGGIGFVAGCVIGAVGAWIVDGTVEAFTGKSVGSWIATGINAVRGV